MRVEVITCFSCKAESRSLKQFVGDPDWAERRLVDEWRQMWQQCLKTTDLRIVDVRVTEHAGEVAK